MLSEIDINDMLNLYELDRDSLFKLYNLIRSRLRNSCLLFLLH